MAAPVLIDATIRSTAKVKPPESGPGEPPRSGGVQPGYARLYVEAEVSALIRSPDPLPPLVGYVVDIPLDRAGRLPKLKRLRVLLFARTTRTPGQIQLVRTDAQRYWNPEADALTRRIATELVAPGAAPAITGVATAFHTPGALPGEGETQIFLTTEGDSRISLNITRKQGQPPRWSPAVGDVVDDAAAPPAHDTLLWYRLACGLPAALPETSTAGITPEEAELARADYRFVLESLGSCGRPPA
ncbi:hypothetical protein [Sphingomonas immobilis]|uniref:hypothetical protein n=1 Tax=Sphingomonas immobilis TaxID=3063997 RepID=UPI00272AC246|nr:hypothetical protein [Sphingomonas sp. CA1-15]